MIRSLAKESNMFTPTRLLCLFTLVVSTSTALADPVQFTFQYSPGGTFQTSNSELFEIGVDGIVGGTATFSSIAPGERPADSFSLTASYNSSFFPSVFSLNSLEHTILLNSFTFDNDGSIVAWQAGLEGDVIQGGFNNGLEFLNEVQVFEGVELFQLNGDFDFNPRPEQIFTASSGPDLFESATIDFVPEEQIQEGLEGATAENFSGTASWTMSQNAEVIPEPGSLTLLGLGSCLVGVIGRRRHRR